MSGEQRERLIIKRLSNTGSVNVDVLHYNDSQQQHGSIVFLLLLRIALIFSVKDGDYRHLRYDDISFQSNESATTLSTEKG